MIDPVFQRLALAVNVAQRPAVVLISPFPQLARLQQNTRATSVDSPNPSASNSAGVAYLLSIYTKANLQELTLSTFRAVSPLPSDLARHYDPPT